MSERLNEYLVREASDYLDQLSRLLEEAAPADPEHLLRLARGARGSAQLAGAETLASVAARLEDTARAVVSGSVAWSEELRALALHTTRDLQLLLRALNRWGPAEDARLRAALERWSDPNPEEPVTELVPIQSLYFDDTGPHVLSAPRRAAALVPIESLLLRGDAALREALALRGRLESLLPAGADGARPLLDELFDLVRLGMQGEHARG